jgi:hypothetical protein
MASKWMAMHIACIALTAATGARAASAMPEKTGACVAYCAGAGHFAACKNHVVEIDLAVLAAKVLGNAATKDCALPKGVGNDNATKQILLWLGNHKNVHAMATVDGVQAAVKALWHCKRQIGDGAVPGGPPAKTGAFVAYCRTHSVKCADEMVTVSVSIDATILVQGKSKHCMPPKTLKNKKVSAAVLDWLGQHKETYGLDTVDGIEVAFDHLWPCRH